MSGADLQSRADEIRSIKARTPPSTPRTTSASPRFLMAEPMASRDGSSSVKHRVSATRRGRSDETGDDVPVMRPEDLSRELSQAHRATSAIEERQRKQLSFARMLVVMISATIAALTTYIALHL